MDRRLSGVFVRIQRDGKWQSIDITDLTSEEMNRYIEAHNKSKDMPFWINLSRLLGERLHEIGDAFNLIMEEA